MLFMAGLMVVLTTVIYNILNKSTNTTKRISRSLQINSRLKEVLNTMVDAETGERGYIITGNELFLQPYLTSKQKNTPLVNPDSLLAYIPEYAEKVTDLNRFIKHKLGYVDTLIALVRAGKQAKAIEITNTGRGRLLMDSIRAAVNDMQAAEASKINSVYPAEVDDNKKIFVVLVSVAGCCIILLLVYYKMVLRNAHLREKTEAGLLEAKNIAETANRAKTNFLALMSHEIRTPMQDIIATSSLLSETGITDEQQAHCDTIYGASMALLSVVNDIIDFSRIETGAIPLENTPFVLRDCLDEVFAAAAPSTSLGRRLYYVEDTIPALIECDPARLRQVLLSILGNAPKAIENGEIGLSIRLISSTNDNLILRFTVMNTNASHFNMPENGQLAEENTRYQPENNLFGISSLRFSITARLISLMGGTIKLVDENSKGNTVTFTIKANRVDEKSSELFFSKRKKIDLLDSKLSNTLPLNILVADDYEMNQVLLVQILAKMGYSCKTARNGAEAAGMAIDTKFDVIFMDIAMPVMDGFEASKRISEYYINSFTPVIIGVTANALLEDKQKALEAGMVDLIIKPYKPVDVQDMLKKYGTQILTPLATT